MSQHVIHLKLIQYRLSIKLKKQMTAAPCLMTFYGEHHHFVLWYINTIWGLPL